MRVLSLEQDNLLALGQYGGVVATQLSGFSKWSMLLGNLFEHYDNALFSLLSPFLAPIFFPGQDPITALILTYCIIPLGMIARPFGSLVFGYIGDTKGRKEALVISLSGMAIITGCLGFIPVYSQVGILAPILLSLGRVIQNFFAAGETIGGAILLIENSPENEHNWTSSIYNASTIAGILLASFGVSVLCLVDGVKDCWRLLYFIGSSTAIFACLLRMKLKLPPQKIDKSTAVSFFSNLKTCWNLRYPLMTIAIASGFSYASYTIALVMMNGFVPLISTITQDQMMHLNTFLLIIDFLFLPLFGIIANRFSREKMMLLSGIVAVISGAPLFWFLEGASLFAVICVRFCLVLIGVWFSAPFHAWSQKLIPTEHRYTVVSFAYAIGSQLLGGPTAAVSIWLFQKTHIVASAAGYWMLLACVTSFLIAKQVAASRNQNELPIQDG